MLTKLEVLLESTDALLIIDIQNDFLSNGTLPIPDGEQIIPNVNNYIKIFNKHKLPIFVIYEWHPKNHIEFQPPNNCPTHGIQNTNGARISPKLNLPKRVVTIAKGVDPNVIGYSGFTGTDLKELLNSTGILRVFVAGFATDYCVKATVVDALEFGFKVMVFNDAIRGFTDSGSISAKKVMLEKGAIFC